MGLPEALPTTGPNMLRDIFPYLLEEGRNRKRDEPGNFAHLPQTRGRPARWTRRRVNYALNELIIGVGEVALLAGLTQVVCVFDARMFRVVKAAGCNPQIIGRPQRFGNTMSYAELFDTAKVPQGVPRRHRHNHSVLAPGAKELAFA